MISHLIYAMPTPHVLLIGLVNIHTEQAEKLLHFLEGLPEGLPEGLLASERAMPQSEPAILGAEGPITLDGFGKGKVSARPSERKLVPVPGDG